MRSALSHVAITAVCGAVAVGFITIGACVTGVEPWARPGGTGGGGASTGSMGQGGNSANSTNTTGPGTTTSSTTSTGSGGSGAGPSGAGGGGSPPTSGAGGGAGGSVPLGSLEVLYQNGDSGTVNDDQLKPHFSLKNNGSTTVPLNEVKIRYYYSMETGQSPQVFHCDYAMVGSGTITGTFGTLASSAATHFLEVGFTTGSLASGAETGEIQARFHWTDYAAVDETNDYSYEPYTAVQRFNSSTTVTAYHNGMLVWGTEPP